MIVKLETLERQLQQAAARFVSPEEAIYFAAMSLETHLRKAPRMNPLEDAVRDLKVWAGTPERQFSVEVDKAGVMVLNFNGLAPALKMKSLHDQLESRARRCGIAALGFPNSSGMITLNPWSEGLARRELIGLAMFNGGTRCTVPYGGTRGVFGTLPLAYAIPTEDRPIILDMALTEIPFFQIKKAKETGTPLPEGAAVDRQGRPTTDAAAALGEDGVANLLPIGGGVKGYGLVMLAEILTGALVRSLLSSEQTPGWHPPEYGALLLAIDIGSFTDLAVFKAAVSALCHALRAQAPAQGFEGVIIPGDRGHASAAAARSAGEIEVKDQVMAELEQLAAPAT
jgi:LDH2 family malate/lactate/ureidoglycolate dehydrogenase